MLLRLLIGACAVCLAPSVAPRAHGGETPDVVRVLHGWQQESADATRPTVEHDLADHAGELSAHELEAAAKFCGPVSARELIQQYEWTAAIGDDGRVVLTAVPRDELGRLFFSAVEIEFPAGAARPSQLRFRNAANRARTVAVSVPALNGPIEQASAVRTAQTGIQLASFDSVENEEVDASSVPSIDEVLAAWKSATQTIERAEIEFAEYKYDRLSLVEKRNVGRVHFEAPDHGLYEVREVEIAAGEKSTQSGRNGEPYTFASDDPMILYWEDGRCIWADPKRRTYIEIELGPPQQMLDAALDVHSDGYLERYRWSVLKCDAQRITLSASPLTFERHLITRMDVILDRKTNLALATRLIHARPGEETVRIITKFAINDDASQHGWEPDLSEYESSTR